MSLIIVRTVDTANALLLAGSKVSTLITALELVMDPLPEGATLDAVDVAVIKLKQVQDSLTFEGNTLNSLGDSS